MSTTLEQVRQAERKVVEAALLSHLICEFATDLRLKGWKLRPDILMHLDRATEVAFERAPEEAKPRLAHEMQDKGEQLLRELRADDVQEALLALCFFILKLVDEGLIDDAFIQPVMVAMYLTEDAKANGTEWKWREDAVRRAVGALLVRANFLGLYVKPSAIPLASSLAL
jgi:hypothetical protein